MANSIGDLIRELGDLALGQMNRDQLEAAAMFDAHSEEFAPNLAYLAEGLGCLIAQDVTGRRPRQRSYCSQNELYP